MLKVIFEQKLKIDKYNKIKILIVSKVELHMALFFWDFYDYNDSERYLLYDI